MGSDQSSQCSPCELPESVKPRLQQIPSPLGANNGHTQQVNSICLFAANTRALTASSDGTLKVWDLNIYSVRYTLVDGHAGLSVLSCAVANGTRALSGGADNKLRVWDLENHSIVGKPILGHSGSITCIKAARGVVDRCAVFFSGSTDMTIKKWQVAMDGSALVVATFMGHEGVVRCISLYDSDRRLASGGSDGVVKLWDVGTRRCLETLQGHSGSVNCCEVSTCPTAVQDQNSVRASRQQDGRTLVVSGGSDETLRVWDVDQSRCIAVLQGHFESVTCCNVYANSLRGLLLLSGSLDETLKVWEIPTFIFTPSDQQPPLIHCCHTLSGHEGGVTSCVAYTNGDIALSGSFDKTMKVWDIPNS